MEEQRFSANGVDLLVSTRKECNYMKRCVIGNMTKKLMTKNCAFCGKEYVAMTRRWKPTCSPECGQFRLKTSIRNLRDKTGPAYHRWRDNLRQYFEYKEKGG